MDHFNYQDQQLHCEDIAVSTLAKHYGTPLYIYSQATIERHVKVLQQALTNQSHLICYAVKANSNIAILQLLAKQGLGFDVVSMGELQRVIKAGGDPQKTVFSGVAKTAEEIRFALTHRIYCFNVESIAECERINHIAGQLNINAPIALRLNPNVDAQTHPHIATGLADNKFGIPIANAIAFSEHIKQLTHLTLLGLSCHIGSQITQVEPFCQALTQLLTLREQYQQHGLAIHHLDIGGGLGVPYIDETPPSPADYVNALKKTLDSTDIKLMLEPGRVIMANAGILVTEVQYIKHAPSKHFAIVDAGMNDLLRPALYNANHNIVNIKQSEQAETNYDIVGPVCETADFFAKDRALNVAAGDLLAIRSAGAYGFTMSSNYNSRPRVAEVLVRGDQHFLIRQRETIEQLYANEQLLED